MVAQQRLSGGEEHEREYRERQLERQDHLRQHQQPVQPLLPRGHRHHHGGHDGQRARDDAPDPWAQPQVQKALHDHRPRHRGRDGGALAREQQRDGEDDGPQRAQVLVEQGVRLGDAWGRNGGVGVVELAGGDDEDGAVDDGGDGEGDDEADGGVQDELPHLRRGGGPALLDDGLLDVAQRHVGVFGDQWVRRS